MKTTYRSEAKGKTLNIGDRVRATRPLAYGLIQAGRVGTVIAKFAPLHATGCWTITVDFQEPGWCPIQFSYPTDAVEAQ
jgi:hypothetical protein